MPSKDPIPTINCSINTLYVDTLTLQGSFLETAARFADLPGTVVLMSGGDLDCARYHILAVNPWLTLWGHACHMRLTLDGETHVFAADPFDTLRRVLEDCACKGQNPEVPVAAGLFGYWAYDLKDCIERLPRTSVDDLGLPHLCLYAPSLILVYDKQRDLTYRCLSIRSDTNVDQAIHEAQLLLSRTPEKKLQHGAMGGGNGGGLISGFSRPQYEAAVERIRDYIVAGDVYQVNLSQRFQADFSGDPFSLFVALYEANPAPFFAYVNAGDHWIVSTSPERYLTRQGQFVETRPIKGTRPRGATPTEDAAFKQALVASAKDDAELSMIVDLLRNDIGKVCEAGSVKISAHKRLEAYQNVYHLVSIVDGVLDCDQDSVDLLRATFPGGSITGCPKIRAMEIIDELEPVRRHIYTGAIGYVSFHDTMDLSIAIRTATIYQNRIYFSVGGGVVYDSGPADEYEETLHKGRTLMAAFQGTASDERAKSVVWLNGLLKPASEASVPISDEGLLYGNGFFETIRVERGRPILLMAHMARFGQSWKDLFGCSPPDLTWSDIIAQVIERNYLADQCAAIKILATRGHRDIPPYNHTLLVTARPYHHRLTDGDRKGLDLVSYPRPRHTPLADHKTLNYLFYLRAGRRAREQGAHEALILNVDGSVSETNSANLLFIHGNTVILPISTHVLPGVTAQAVCDILKQQGFLVREELVLPSAFFRADQVLLTNSLMGAVRVASLDGQTVGTPSRVGWRINAVLFG